MAHPYCELNGSKPPPSQGSRCGLGGGPHHTTSPTEVKSMCDGGGLAHSASFALLATFQLWWSCHNPPSSSLCLGSERVNCVLERVSRVPAHKSFQSCKSFSFAQIRTVSGAYAPCRSTCARHLSSTFSTSDGLWVHLLRYTYPSIGVFFVFDFEAP